DAYRSGLETGDFTYATYAIFHESWYGFLTGNDLTGFVRDYSPNLMFLRQIKNYSFVDAQQVILSWGSNLYAAGEFDEQTYLEKYQNDAFFMTFFYITRLYLLFLSEKYTEARECAKKGETVAHALVGTIWPELLSFYHALTLSADWR